MTNESYLDSKRVAVEACGVLAPLFVRLWAKSYQDKGFALFLLFLARLRGRSEIMTSTALKVGTFIPIRVPVAASAGNDC